MGGNLNRKLLGRIFSSPFPLPLSIISYVIIREESNIDEQEIIDALSQFVVLEQEETASFLHSLIPMRLTDMREARKLYIDDEWAFEYFITILNEIYLLYSADTSRRKGAKVLSNRKGNLSRKRTR